MRVVLTSFEPFGGQVVNSSLEVGRSLARRPPPGVDLDWVVLPVVAGVSVTEAWTRIEQAEPHLVLALGQAAGADALRLETTAVNLNDFAIADNAGNLLQRQPITRGPAAYRTTAWVKHVARQVGRRNIAAELSGSAGRFVCNHLYYGLLHRAAQAQKRHQTAFIHLPLLPGQVRRREFSPSRELDYLVEGVRTAIVACLEGVGGPAVRDSAADARPQAPGKLSGQRRDGVAQIVVNPDDRPVG